MIYGYSPSPGLTSILPRGEIIRVTFTLQYLMVMPWKKFCLQNLKTHPSIHRRKYSQINTVDRVIVVIPTSSSSVNYRAYILLLYSISVVHVALSSVFGLYWNVNFVYLSLTHRTHQIILYYNITTVRVWSREQHHSYTHIIYIYIHIIMICDVIFMLYIVV